jgi:hypothetical protein
VNSKERIEFHRTVCGLAVATRSNDWATGEVGERDPAKMAKPIPPQRWGKAFRLACDIDESVAGLPTPEPSADPQGFVWLTWERGPRVFSLGLRSDKFSWWRKTPEIEATSEAPTIGDVVDVLKATFS